jgi:ketosteroid isomerase-like protein
VSQENVEIYREGNEAYNRGDWDALAATWDPHIVARNDPSWPEWGCHGREAVVAFFKGVRESWGTRADIEEILDLGDRLLVRIRYPVRAPRSGVEGEQRYSQLVTFRDGRTILVEHFLEHDRALEALEIRE